MFVPEFFFRGEGKIILGLLKIVVTINRVHQRDRFAQVLECELGKKIFFLVSVKQGKIECVISLTLQRSFLQSVGITKAGAQIIIGFVGIDLRINKCVVTSYPESAKIPGVGQLGAIIFSVAIIDRLISGTGNIGVFNRVGDIFIKYTCKQLFFFAREKIRNGDQSYPRQYDLNRDYPGWEVAVGGG